jgi:hypothetical protein
MKPTYRVTRPHKLADVDGDGLLWWQMVWHFGATCPSRSLVRHVSAVQYALVDANVGLTQDIDGVG